MIRSLPLRRTFVLAKEAGTLLGWSLMGFLLSLGASWAQTPTAKVTGTVRDPSGAVISGVTVTIVNLQTGTRADSTANERGIYSISFLNPGLYEMTAESQGFKRHVRQNVRLETGQVAAIDITLEIGEVSETVNVTAATPLLQAETSSVGQLIENTTIINMPLASRRAASLVRLMGGVTFMEGAADEALPLFSMAGGRARNQMWYIDGGVAQKWPLDFRSWG